MEDMANMTDNVENKSAQNSADIGGEQQPGNSVADNGQHDRMMPQAPNLFNGALVINQETPPLYNGNSRAELAAWYIQAKDYYNRMIASGNAIPLRALFHPEKLCYIANWELDEHMEVSLLTDEILSTYVGRQLAQESTDSVNHVQAAMASLKMEFTPGMPLSGVEKFMQSFEKNLQRCQLSSMRESEEGRI